MKDKFGLEGKTALVTGASRGIGEACARVLDQAGARVLLVGRTTSDLERVAADLQHAPVVLSADMAPSRAGAALAEAVLEHTESVDVLVNNAGIPMRRTPEALTEDELDQTYAINVRALLMLTTALSDALAAGDGASVINISSIASLRGPQGRVAYSASKGAVDALTRALAADWGPRGIRVNAVCPGIITTAIWEHSRNTVPGLIEELAAQVPLKRWGNAEDVADAVLFFASALSRYVTGEVVAVDGGMARLAASPERLPELE